MSTEPDHVVFRLVNATQTSKLLDVRLQGDVNRNTGDFCLDVFKKGLKIYLVTNFQEALLDALRSENLELKQQLAMAELNRSILEKENEKMKRALSVLDRDLR